MKSKIVLAIVYIVRLFLVGLAVALTVGAIYEWGYLSLIAKMGLAISVIANTVVWALLKVYGCELETEVKGGNNENKNRRQSKS